MEKTVKTIKIYGYATSPYVRKTGCFLYYKGLEFTHVPVNPLKTKATIGHTNGTQVPVLEVDGEWRRESSDHARWLDELFPDKPLYPGEHRAKIDEIDRWISDTHLISIFRRAIDGDFNTQFLRRAWRLAAIVNAGTPIPAPIRLLWPVALRRAPFIRDMAKHMDLTEGYEDMQVRICSELIGHIGDGPYMGGLDQPTMLDGGSGTAAITVGDAASVTAGQITINDGSTLTIDGAGSSVVVSPSGQPYGSYGLVSVYSTDGQIAISDGVLDATRLNLINTTNPEALQITGGQVNVNSRAYIGGNTMGPLIVEGSDNAAELNFGATGSGYLFYVNDGIEVGANATTTLTSGHLRTSSITETGGDFIWDGGSLSITSDDVTIGASGILDGAIEISSNTDYDSLNVGGTLTIDGDPTPTPADAGALTLGSGGGLSAERIELQNGGTFTYDGGSFNLTGTEVGDGLEVSSSGLLGDNVVLGNGDTVTVAAGALVTTGSQVQVAGGRFTTGTLDLDGDLSGLDFVSGTVDVTTQDVVVGTGGLFSGLGLIDDTRTLNVTQQLTISDEVVTLDGGQLTSGQLEIQDGNGGQLNFESGELYSTQNLSIGGAGGVTGASGSSTVSLGLSDRLGSSGMITLDGGSVLDIDGAVVNAGGFDGTGRIDLTSGSINVYGAGSDLNVGGPGGVAGAGGSSTVNLYGGLGGGSLRVRQGDLNVNSGTLRLDGGYVEANNVSIDPSASFEFIHGGLRVDSSSVNLGGAGGITGAGGGAIVISETVGGGGDYVVGNNVNVQAGTTTVTGRGGLTSYYGATVASGAVLNIDGGNVSIGGDLDIDGTVNFTSGELWVRGGETSAGGDLNFSGGTMNVDGDLYIGSSYSVVNGYLMQGDGVDPGYHFTIDDDMEIDVGLHSTTYVDSSNLHILAGGRLSTGALSGGINVDVDVEGELFIKRLDVTANSVFSGVVIAEQIDIAANLDLASDAEVFADLFIGSGGSLSGTGMITGGLTNTAGSINAGNSPGELSIDGFLTQLDDGNIILEVGQELSSGDLISDVLSVSGVVELAGTLDVVIDLVSAGLDAIFDPSAEDAAYTFLTASSITGLFSDVLNRDLGDGNQWILTYWDTSLSLSIGLLGSEDIDLRSPEIVTPVPEPGTALLVGLGLYVLGARRKRSSKI